MHQLIDAPQAMLQMQQLEVESLYCFKYCSNLALQRRLGQV